MKRNRTNRTVQRKAAQAAKRIFKRQQSMEMRAIYLQSLRTSSPKYYDEHSQKEEVGALIAKYKDYVSKGIIRPRSFVDNYEQASWMSSILTEPEMKKVLNQADKWMQMSAIKRAQRLADQPTIDF